MGAVGRIDLVKKVGVGFPWVYLFFRKEAFETTTLERYIEIYIIGTCSFVFILLVLLLLPLLLSLVRFSLYELESNRDWASSCRRLAECTK